MKRPHIWILTSILLCLGAAVVWAEGTTATASAMPWWGWALLLFVFTLVLGVLAVVAGVGGGVLFVPIVAAVFPFHLDFVRGAGLMVALSGALAAGPKLLRSGMADLRLALPMALFGSVGSILGARVGLALPTNVIEISLGIAIVSIVLLMLATRASTYPKVGAPGRLSTALSIHGIFYEPTEDRQVSWQIHRGVAGLAIFVVIGFLAGVFGLGAGWANVPALNLLLGAPLKLAIGTSGLILTINDSAAAWVYINRGAVLPVIAVPAVGGMMLGASIGARLLTRVPATIVRWVVIVVLFLAGIRSIIGGIGGIGP